MLSIIKVRNWFPHDNTIIAHLQIELSCYTQERSEYMPAVLERRTILQAEQSLGLASNILDGVVYARGLTHISNKLNGKPFVTQSPTPPHDPLVVDKSVIDGIYAEVDKQIAQLQKMHNQIYSSHK